MEYIEDTSNLKITHKLDTQGYFESRSPCVFREDCDYYKMDRRIWKDGVFKLLIYEHRPTYSGAGLYLAEEVV